MTRDSKRNLQNRVESLETNQKRGYPVIGDLATFLCHDWEGMEQVKGQLYRDTDGQIYYVDPDFEHALRDSITSRYPEAKS